MRLRHVRTIATFGTVATLALLVAGCGGSDDGGSNGGTGPTGSTSNAIDVRDNSYSPSSTTVPAGTTVTWTWRGSASHDVTFTTEHSAVKSTGTYQRTFNSAGTFDYHCSIHGSAMSGRIVVQ